MTAKFKLTLIAMMVQLLAVMPLYAAADSILDLMDQVDKLDKLEKVEFNEFINRARSCVKNRDFSCAEQNITRSTKLANSSNDRQMISDTRSMIEQEKILIKREEDQRQVQLAEAEKRAREAQDRADTKALFGAIASAVTSSAIQLQQERAAQRVLSEQIRSGLYAKPSSPTTSPAPASTISQSQTQQRVSSTGQSIPQSNQLASAATYSQSLQSVSRNAPPSANQTNTQPTQTVQAGTSSVDSTSRLSRGEMRPVDPCDSPSRVYAIPCQRGSGPTTPSRPSTAPNPSVTSPNTVITAPTLPVPVAPFPTTTIRPNPYVVDAPAGGSLERRANGESAMGCLNATTKKSPFDEKLVEVAISNRCGEPVFVLWCSDGLAYSRERCGQGPRSGYFTHHATIEVGGSKTFEIGPNASYSYNGCKGTMSFGNQGEFRDSGTGQIECLINRNRM